MVLLKDIASLESGVTQFRIEESSSENAAKYCIYSQSDLEDDLACKASGDCKKWIQTDDAVSTLKSDDLLFGLLSGKAAIVGPAHDGYVFTQNYVRITPNPSIDSKFLAFILNENEEIRRQLMKGQQGSATMKFTVKQLAELRVPVFPSLEKQESIGKIYFMQLELADLKKHHTDLETKLLFGQLKEVDE